MSDLVVYLCYGSNEATVKTLSKMSTITIKTFTFSKTKQIIVNVTGTNYAAQKQSGLINNKSFALLKGQYVDGKISNVILKDVNGNSLFMIGAVDFYGMINKGSINIPIWEVTYHSKEIGYTRLNWKQKTTTEITEYNITRKD